MNKLLTLAENDKNIFTYLMNLPPPAYTCAKYTDWIKPYLESFISDAIKFYSAYNNFNKEEIAKESLKRLDNLENKMSEFSQNIKNDENNFLTGLNKNYLIWNNITTHEISRTNLDLIGENSI